MPTTSAAVVSDGADGGDDRKIPHDEPLVADTRNWWCRLAIQQHANLERLDRKQTRLPVPASDIERVQRR